jgi:Arc/MetJ-type ribon-helix-helix transcriptional regulator
MRKTTVYLPEDVKENLSRMAAESGRSEAELIRQALVMMTTAAERPRPHGSLFDSQSGGLADEVDEGLAGFGER